MGKPLVRDIVPGKTAESVEEKPEQADPEAPVAQAGWPDYPWVMSERQRAVRDYPPAGLCFGPATTGTGMSTATRPHDVPAAWRRPSLCVTALLAAA